MSDTQVIQRLTPRLVVDGGAKALDFYTKAFGAEVLERFEDPDGRIVHSALKIGDVIFSVVEQAPEHQNTGPAHLGGSSVILELEASNADAVAKRMTDAGAEVVFALDDRFYGRRDGRFRDPFGHLWIISQHLEKLTDDEIQKRVDAFHEG